MVPVVFGTTRQDYEKVAPADSFIHVDDFENAEQLAKYLLKLDKNDHLYNKYFQWKQHYESIDTKFWCRLCAMLNTPRVKVYQNLTEWWEGRGICKR